MTTPAQEALAALERVEDLARHAFVPQFRDLDIIRAALEESGRLNTLLNTPETANFLDGVRREAAHQVERWGTAHDRAKEPADWFWLIGYLGGKALAAHIAGNVEKAQHHTISSAAALANWHAAISGTDTRMAPGKSDLEERIEQTSGAARAAEGG